MHSTKNLPSCACDTPGNESSNARHAAVEAARLTADIEAPDVVQQNVHASTAAVPDYACARVEVRCIVLVRLAALALGMNRNDSCDLRENKCGEYQGC